MDGVATVAANAGGTISALNHSASNAANALGPWLGGVAIAAGLAGLQPDGSRVGWQCGLCGLKLPCPGIPRRTHIEYRQ